MPNMAMAEETMLAAAFAALPVGTPVDWPNKEWDPVAHGPHPREGIDAWATVHVLHGGSDQMSMGSDGSRVFTRGGSIVVQVFVPAGQRGLADASALAMAATGAFEGKTIDGVRFYRVGSRTVGRDGSWFQVNVSADFEFDEVK